MDKLLLGWIEEKAIADWLPTEINQLRHAAVLAHETLRHRPLPLAQIVRVEFHQGR